MPLPAKRKNESKKKFMSRCLVDLTTKKEFKDIKQRIAVCMSHWEKSSEK